MSVLQSRVGELRYIKRKNLEEEAKIVGGYFRDLIRSYGVDVTYRKLDTSEFNNFNGIIDQNAILKYAYGYPIVKDYSLSAHMIAFLNIEADLFNLNKYGIVPDTTTEFYFDRTDFACSLCEKLGQFKEYPINETEIKCEVPLVSNNEDENSVLFPYNLGLGYNENFTSEVLSGKLSVAIDKYEYDKEYKVLCHIYEHGDFKCSFPANEHLAKSFQHKLQQNEYVDNLIHLTYKIKKVLVDPNGKTEKEKYKAILTGKINGSILFYDLNSIGKYLDIISPSVGDLITIDFPDENNREQYEITDCFDKQLTPDGINPLLHKYIWKCKARRYINSYEENPDETEGDNRVEEKHKFDQLVEEEISKEIGFYDKGQDALYGGYDGNINEYDSQEPQRPDLNMFKREKMEFLDDGTALDIIRFGCGSRLVTDGYDLLFMTKSGDFYKITTTENRASKDTFFNDNLRFLKASKNRLVFVNIIGESFTICETNETPRGKLELDLNSLYDSTIDVGKNINKNGDNFYKFKESKTYLLATEDNLYCRLEGDDINGMRLII